MQRLLGALRRAEERDHLIEAGDSIAVGLSGGKDSLALLALLCRYRDFSPRPFRLHAFTLKLGEPFDTAPLEEWCRGLNVPLTIENMDILPALEKEKSPCALCARLRRGYLCRMAREAGCNKLALGHHREDDLETYLMSGLSEGRFYQLQPKTEMENAGVTLIRPLLDVKEAALADLARRYGMPVMKNPCPVDGKTNRAEIKEILSALEHRRPGALDQLARALARQRKEESP